jgi:CheY-like chemotaxis protein
MPRPCHILIIGDMPSEIAVLRESLKDAQWNATVDEVFTGDASRYAAAYSDLDEIHPDILISDIHHRGESCIDILTQIRAVPQWSNQPLLLCTAYRLSHSTMYECIGLGVREVIIKPRTYAGIVDMAVKIRSHLISIGELSPAGSWLGSMRATASRLVANPPGRYTGNS